MNDHSATITAVFFRVGDTLRVRFSGNRVGYDLDDLDALQEALAQARVRLTREPRQRPARLRLFPT